MYTNDFSTFVEYLTKTLTEQQNTYSCAVLKCTPYETNLKFYFKHVCHFMYKYKFIELTGVPMYDVYNYLYVD